MQSRPHSGGVTAKRSTVAFAGVLALAILAVLLKAPNRQGVTRQHPPSPSAAEESAISEPVGTVESRVWSTPEDTHGPRPQIPRGHHAAPKGRDNHPTPSATLHDPSSSSEEARIGGNSAASPGDLSRSGVFAPHNLESKLGVEARVEEGQVTVSGARDDPQGAAGTPLLTPPVLVSGSLQYPTEGYRIVVDHSGSVSGVGMDAAAGRVRLKILVLADGSVRGVEVAQSSGRSSLDAAAVREVSRWKFAPATRDGQPIDAWALVPLLFVLR